MSSVSTFSRRASVSRARLRAALCGTTKSGKTFDSLVIASTLIETLREHDCLKGNGTIGLIDSEHGRSDDYADVFEFYNYELSCYAPEAYIDALQGMINENHSVIIIDQISHEWAGTSGILEQTSITQKQSGGKHNSFTAWSETTPRHNAFIESLVRCPIHLICTMRVKQDWVLEVNEKGKHIPRKLGMAPIQRDSTDYEFDIVGTIDDRKNLNIETRGTLSMLLGNRSFKPGPDIHHPGEVAEIGKLVGQWIAGRANAQELGLASREQIDEIQGLGEKLGFTYETWKKFFNNNKISSLSRMTPEIYEVEKANLLALIAKIEAKKAASQERRNGTTSQV